MDDQKVLITVDLTQERANQLAYVAEITGLSGEEILGLLIEHRGIEGIAKRAWEEHGVVVGRRRSGKLAE